MNRIVRWTMIVLGVLMMVFIISLLVSIKFCLTSLPQESREDFYIITYLRSENRYLLLGDSNGFFALGTEPKHYVRAASREFLFSKELSVDLHSYTEGTIFIVYGKSKIDESWETYYGDTGDAILHTLDDTGWDILGKISTANNIRDIFPKNHLNIYDYRWFDILRVKLYSYLDGITNF